MTPPPLPMTRDEDGPFAGTVTVTLDQPGRPVVVLDESLIRDLESTLDAVPSDATGLVLASASERVFVAGADLKTIQAFDDDRLLEYLAYGQRVFGRLARFAFPTVAAINGAALGGGLELAMHCDGLVAAPSASGKPYPIGLPEAGLNICPGWGGTNLLPARIDPEDAIRRTASGSPMKFDEAVEAGMFDAVCEEPSGLLNGAKQWLVERRAEGPVRRDGAPWRWIGRGDQRVSALAGLDAARSSLPASDAARAVADSVEAGLSRGWDAALETERTRLTSLRSLPAGRQSIADFFAKSAAR